MDRSDLVARAAAGDGEAFRELVDAHAGLVWSIIRSFRLSSADAQDAAQGVWLAVVQHLGQLRDPERLAGWIATTTRRECLAVLQRSQRLAPDPVASLASLRTVDREPGPEDRVVASVRSRAVVEAFDALDARCRELLSMLLADPPIPYRVISEELGLAVGAIGPTRSRCLDKLRRHRAIVALLDPSDRP
jgi:RNA polymerase sigma factor (sigma-70 family)